MKLVFEQGLRVRASPDGRQQMPARDAYRGNAAVRSAKTRGVPTAETLGGVIAVIPMSSERERRLRKLWPSSGLKHMDDDECGCVRTDDGECGCLRTDAD